MSETIIPVAQHAPPLESKPVPPKMPRGAMIGILVVGVLLALLPCAVTVVVLSVTFKVGPLAHPAVGTTARPVVGKWESVGGAFSWGSKKATAEFRNDGTGTFEMEAMLLGENLNPKQLADRGIKDGIEKHVFKWRVTSEEKPVLVIDADPVIGWGEFMFFKGQTHSHFAREGDTITISPLGSPGHNVVLRRVN